MSQGNKLDQKSFRSLLEALSQRLFFNKEIQQSLDSLLQSFFSEEPKFDKEEARVELELYSSILSKAAKENSNSSEFEEFINKTLLQFSHRKVFSDYWNESRQMVRMWYF
jgi:hypothetical protein